MPATLLSCTAAMAASNSAHVLESVLLAFRLGWSARLGSFVSWTVPSLRVFGTAAQHTHRRACFISSGIPLALACSIRVSSVIMHHLLLFDTSPRHHTGWKYLQVAGFPLRYFKAQRLCAAGLLLGPLCAGLLGSPLSHR